MTVAHSESVGVPTADVGQRVNIADRLAEVAERLPNKKAVVWPTGRDRGYAQVTFRELSEDVGRLAAGMRSVGITRGTRTILFVKPGKDFFALVFALFKVGAVPVMIDPGIGKQQMRACLSEVAADAFIGIPLAHVFRKLFPKAFTSVKTWITVGRRWCWGGLTLSDVRTAASGPVETSPTCAGDPAAILFTSGSTGPAKGVNYTHGTFDAQVRYLQSHFGFSEEDADLPTFPLFALFDAALGMTAVIPDMDFTKPGSVDPRRIISPIVDHGLTQMFGSPALLDRLSRFGMEHSIKLPTIRRVITAGAPVSPAILERLSRMLPASAEIHTPYGATEALPVASITGSEILADTAARSAQGGGTCVGQPMPEVDVRIIGIDDDPIGEWSDVVEVPRGDIGEIVVRGPMVTESYHNRPDATKLAKIGDGDTVWHRMGDVGYFDEAGRLWFCGRKAHRVITKSGTMFTVPCESIINQHELVRRCALVGVGDPGHQVPVLCLELEPSAPRGDHQGLTQELLGLASGNELTRNISKVLFHKSLPVDVRHNSKIFREKLAVWAAERLS
jgi:olefin beta-lactone synthetase